jgi:hypothetical protein
VPEKTIRPTTAAEGYTKAASETFSQKYGSEKLGISLVSNPYPKKLGHILEFFAYHDFNYIK